MCGIVGIAGRHDAALVRRMGDIIAHRGPDGDGYYEAPEAGVCVGMRRLAIIDLVRGDQPLHSASDDVHLVYNGEIYNYRFVRAELERLGHVFKTDSDTEVVLEAYLAWGGDAWQRLHGMFAIAIVDERGLKTKLVLVRDRPGMKPLYIWRNGQELVFASEIKALMAHEGMSRDVEIGAVRSYLTLRYVPGPGTLFPGVEKMPAGHELTWVDGEVSIRRWWTPPGAEGIEPGLDLDEAARRFGDVLRTSVHRHMIADVPLGAFLSGGIDSNVIVALMAEVSHGPVKTFSIGFPDFINDDQRLAAITARHFGTDHHVIECRAADMANLSDIAYALDEPIGDAIIVPMGVLAREARRDVKAVLSGEGADEILGGYVFHRKLVQIARLRRLVPRFSFDIAARVVAVLPPALLGRLFDYPGELGSEGRRKVVSMLEQMGAVPLTELYRSAISLFDDADIAAITGGRGALGTTSLSSLSPAVAAGSPLQELVAMQYHHWLPDDILMKADKMTMMHSLEGRIPFMDEGVIAMAAALPDATKLGRAGNKLALRHFGRSILPDEIVNAPKRAFYIPLEAYVREKPLKDIFDWALDPERIRRRGLIDPAWIAAQRNAGEAHGFLPLKRLFSIVMLELWFDRFAPSASWR